MQEIQVAKCNIPPRKIWQPAILLCVFAPLLLAGCQSNVRLATGSCAGATPGTQLAVDCGYVAGLTRTRVAGN